MNELGAVIKGPVWTRPVQDGPPPRGRPRIHSAMVRVLRWLLPAVMAGGIVAIVLMVSLHAVKRREAVQRDAAAPVEMVNPHFFGHDAQGRPYTLGAERASRDPRSFQKVVLVKPWVKFFSDPQSPSTMTADHGVYDEDSRMLHLTGHVAADNAKQTRFNTEEAWVDTKTGKVSSPASVAGSAPAGQLQSNQFDVYDKGDRVVFKGGVHARLNSH